MADDLERMSISISAEKQSRLDTIANRADRTRNWVINQAIDQFLELHEWQEKRIQRRLDRANGNTATFYTSDEVEQLIETLFP